jgi:hypothetical protein
MWGSNGLVEAACRYHKRNYAYDGAEVSSPLRHMAVKDLGGALMARFVQLLMKKYVLANIRPT